MSDQVDEQATWQFFRFGLLLTGRAEEKFLPKLFDSIVQSVQLKCSCHFEVIRFFGQLRPQTSPKKQKIRLPGSKLSLNSNDEMLGLAARAYLDQNPNSFVILIDDLEHNSVNQIQDVYNRYRTAFDGMLLNRKHCASVHFLVNMLETYFFAHAEAINLVLGTELTDHDGDVELIRHPKGDLKKAYGGYDEIDQGKLIIELIDVPKILSNPVTCRSLRTLFGWIWRALRFVPTELYRLNDGQLYLVTQPQIEQLPEPSNSL
jgi:hypothetical protein